MVACRWILAVVVFFANALAADAVTITFDDLADEASVINQYPGLLFSNTTVLTAGTSLNEFEFPPHSGSNVAFDDGAPVQISFSSPILSLAGHFTYLQPVTLTAFDAGNNVLGSVHSAFLNNLAISGDFGSSPNELLGFSSALGISSVVLAGDAFGGSFVLDDVTFQPLQPIPEPGTIFLLGSGLIALAYRRLNI